MERSTIPQLAHTIEIDKRLTEEDGACAAHLRYCSRPCSNHIFNAASPPSIVWHREKLASLPLAIGETRENTRPALSGLGRRVRDLCDIAGLRRFYHLWLGIL